MRKLVLIIFMAALFFARPASAGFEAYNDAAGLPGGASNITYYNGFTGGTSNGFLVDYSTGIFTSVTATLTAVNNYNELRFGAMPAIGTDAYNTFNGKIDLGAVASYEYRDSNWSYEVTFTGLDSTKYYEFVTTANRNSDAYDGDGSDPRWTKFSIIGADTFTNSSSSGVTEITADVLKMNTGYNTDNGYVIAWSGISAAGGSFTVRSENVGLDGPGNAYKSYGIQGFKLAETGSVPVVPEPVSSVLFVVGAAALGLGRFRKMKRK